MPVSEIEPQQVRRPERTGAVPYVYLTGTGHSSSTLVSFLLNVHPQILAIGEMHSPPFPRDKPLERLCSCGTTMVKCPFYNELASRFRAHGLEFDPTEWDFAYAFPGRPAISRLTFRSLRSNALEALRDGLLPILPAYRRRKAEVDRGIEIFAREATAITGTTVFSEAYKDPVRVRYLMSVPGIDLKVLHLIRDPRGYVNSVLKSAKLDPARVARDWCRRHTNIERQLRRLPDDRRFRLRYEDICFKSDETLAAVGEFIGVGPIPVAENYRDSNHHIQGNRMRVGRPGRDSEGRIRHDEKWRSTLDAKTVATVAEVAGPMAREYGYDI